MKYATYLSSIFSVLCLSSVTVAMRTKEAEVDYRFMPEPDLPPLVLTDAYVRW